MKNEIEDYDKYDASKSKRAYVIWLIQSGQAEILEARNNIHLYNPFSGKHSSDIRQLTTEECLEALQEGRDRYKFKCKFQNQIYEVSFSNSDSLHYTEDYGGLEEFFEKHVEKLIEDGEYYIPGTDIPKYKASKVGPTIIGLDDGNYVVADREKIYKQVSGNLIFNGSCVLTEDKTIVYDDGEQEIFSDIIHTNVKNSRDNGTETFIGYNDNIITFIQNRYKTDNREHLSGTSIQKFERENPENPVLIFSTKKTSGFINGKYISISNGKGELTTFEVGEDIKSADIKNGYVLINNNILCCGAIYKQKRYPYDEKIQPFCKKVNNIEQFEEAMQKSGLVSSESFIENEQGCFCVEGLSEQEKLELYKKQGFDDLYQKLESEIQKREEIERKKQQEEIQKKEEEERKLENEKNELKNYVYSADSLLVPVVYSNPEDNMSMNEAKIYNEEGTSTYGRYYADDENVQALYGVQEKGWRGHAYRGLIINVEMAKKLAQKGKLHFNVPEEDMGRIIGRQGSNIQYVTEKLRKKGVNVSKIILHPKTKEEMCITLKTIKENIEKNIQEI